MPEEKYKKILILGAIIMSILLADNIKLRYSNYKAQKTSVEKVATQSNVDPTPNDNKKYRVNTGATKHMSNIEMFQLTEYTDELKERINNSKYMPEAFETPLQVSFIISKDGTIDDCTVKESSGDSKVDKSVLKTIESIGKFKPLPDGYTGNRMLVNLRYNKNMSGMENIPIN